jgi:hypothetical protein
MVTLEGLSPSTELAISWEIPRIEERSRSCPGFSLSTTEAVVGCSLSVKRLGLGMEIRTREFSTWESPEMVRLISPSRARR